MNFVIKERDSKEIGPIKAMVQGRVQMGSLAAVPRPAASRLARAPAGVGAMESIELDEGLLEQQEYMRSNHRMLSAMSDEELQKHVDELKLSVSAKSMEIMQSAAFKRKVGLVAKAPVRGPPPAHAPVSSSASTGDGVPIPANFESTMVMPTTEEELEQLKQSAPAEWKRQIEWTMNKDLSLATTTEEEHKTTDKQQSLFSRSLNRSKYDRFNLEGCKVITKQKTVEDVTTVFAILGVSQGATREMSEALVDAMLRVKFCTEPNLPDSQPQDELLQHEQDPEEPGFSFMEISEMFRSEERHQRGLAFEMLFGILKRREDAASLEAYGLDIESPLSEFKTAFQDIFNKLCSVMADEKKWTDEASEPDRVKNGAYLRRILTFAVLLMCSADLPVALPTLLLWGLKLRLAVPARHQLLKCLSHYMFSECEEQAASNLWNGFWGTYGCPALQTPHDRRMESSYEEYVAHCQTGRDKITFAEATDNPQAPPNPRSFQDEFAARNRWGRVDAMVRDGDLVPSLSHHLEQSLSTAFSSETSDPNASSMIDLALRTVSIILDVCSAIVRIGDLETVDMISAGIVKLYWAKFLYQAAPPLITARWFRLLAETLRRDYSLSSWIAGQRNFLGYLLSVIIRKCHAETLTATDDECVVWGLRVWRVLLCNSIGVETVSEFLIAAQTPPGAAPKIQKEGRHDGDGFSLGPGLTIYSKPLLADFFCFLEQAATSCSAMMMMAAESESDSPKLFSLVELSQLLFATASSASPLIQTVDGVCRSALLHFISSTLGFRIVIIQPQDQTHDSTRLLGLIDTLCVRGKGLLTACEHVVTSHCKSRNTIDARLMHLQGVSECLLETCKALWPCLRVTLETKPSAQHRNISAMSRWRTDETEFAVERFVYHLSTYGVTSQDPASVLKTKNYTPKVTDGLYDWQRSRLKQAGTLNALQMFLFRRVCQASTRPLITVEKEIASEIMLTISSLGQGFVGQTTALLSYLLDSFLNKSASGYAERAQLKQGILGDLFCPCGHDKELLQFQSEVSLRFLSGLCLDAGMAASDWIRLPYNDKIPISSNWYLTCLLSLTGELFAAWIDTVASMERLRFAMDYNPDANSDARGVHAADKLYRILRVACPEHTSRWNEERSDFSVKAGSAFRSLVVSYAVSLMTLSTPSCSRAFFMSSCLDETFNPVGPMRGSDAPRTVSDSGVLELCGKLLDSAMAPLLDHNSHCCSLLLMICPGLTPWKVQQKVWLELSSSRCLHMLDCPTDCIIALIPLFACGSMTGTNPHNGLHIGTARAILAALEGLRRPAEENAWPVCSIALHLLVNFLFPDPGEKIVIDTQKSKFLLELISSTKSGWIPRDMLLMAGARHLSGEILGCEMKPWSVDVSARIGGRLLDFWTRVRQSQSSVCDLDLSWAEEIQITTSSGRSCLREQITLLSSP